MFKPLLKVIISIRFQDLVACAQQMMIYVVLVIHIQ